MRYSNRRCLINLGLLAILSHWLAVPSLYAGSDLQVSPPEFSPASADAGAVLSQISWVLSNKGPDTLLNPSFTFRIYLSRDMFLDNADDIQIANPTLSGGSFDWPPGTSMRLSASATIPSFASGDYHLAVQVLPKGADPNSANDGAVSSGMLRVNGPPIITQYAQTGTARLGDEFSFSCQVVGEQPLVFQWLKDGVALPAARESALRMQHVTRDDAGRYAVVVSNPHGSVVSPTAFLRVVSAAGLHRMLSPLLLDGVFSVAMQTESNKLYSLERCPSLMENRWLPVAFSLGNGAIIDLRDPTRNQTGFYRVSESDAHEKVIYSNDDRLDYFEEADPQLRAWANATCLVTRKEWLSQKSEQLYSLQTFPWLQRIGSQVLPPCSDERFANQRRSEFCTGFLVAEDIIVTAGHCVREISGEADLPPLADVRIVFGYRMDGPEAQKTSFSSSEVYSVKEVLCRPDEFKGTLEDFAVLRLDRPVILDGVSPLPIRQAGQIDVDARVGIVGYPAGLPVKIAFGADTRVLFTDDDLFITNTDSYGGNSGSPVFGVESGLVEGILVAGDTDYESRGSCFASRHNPAAAYLNLPEVVRQITSIKCLEGLLHDQQPAGSLQFSQATYNVAENGGVATVTVRRVGGSFGAVSVNFATGNGTGMAGTDYRAAAGTLSWTGGDATDKTFSVPILDNGVYTGNRTVNLSLGAPTGNATLGTPVNATLTIVEDDPPPPAGSLQFSQASYTVAENGGVATVTVRRVGGSFGAVSVAYATGNGTGVTGTDYTAATGMLSWTGGDAADKTFSVPILDNGVYTGNRTVTLGLGAPTGNATLGTPVNATLTIVEDDPPPPAGSLQFSQASYTVAENGGVATVTVRRVGGSFGAVSVNYATGNGTGVAGTDYTAATGMLSWTGGDAADKTFSVPILDNGVYTGNRMVNLSLGAPTGNATLGTPANATLTIVEDEPVPAAGSLQFSQADYTVAENGGVATVTVRRVGGSFGSVSVNYATGNGTGVTGTDYTAATGMLSWTGGDAADKTFSVSILDNGVYTGNRTVNLGLGAPTGNATLGTPANATLTIVEDEPVPAAGSLQFSQASYNVAENGGVATVTVRRVGGSFGSVSVNYATGNGTGMAETDYRAAAGTLSWTGGDATDKTFSVSILDNGVYTGNRTVNLGLGAPTGNATLGTPANATLTIVEDEPVPAAGSLQFSQADYTVAENGGVATVTVRRVGGSFGAVSVTYATGNGTGVAETDYRAAAGTLSWTGGDATDKTFSVSILDNGVYTGNRTVNLGLGAPTGNATLGTLANATLTIVEDDPPPPAGSLQFSQADYTVAENGGVATVTVRRVGGSFGAVSVNYATGNGTGMAETDYRAAAGTLSWTDGDAADKDLQRVDPRQWGLHGQPDGEPGFGRAHG